MKDANGIPRGIALAIPFATQRGFVMIFVPCLLNPGDFVIAGNGRFVIVRVRYVEKLHADVRQIEADFARTVTLLRLARSGSAGSELWLYSRHGTFRFFRVRDDDIVEIDPLGNVAADYPPVPGSPLPGTIPDPGSAQPPVTPPDPCDVFRHWHAKRNATRKAAGIRNFLDPGILERMCRDADAAALARPGATGEEKPKRDPHTGKGGGDLR